MSSPSKPTLSEPGKGSSDTPSDRPLRLAAMPAQRHLDSAGGVVQRLAKGPLKTNGGEWEATEYREAATGDPGVNDYSTFFGARIKLRFTPEDPANAEVIGLSQAVKSEQKESGKKPQNPFAAPHTGRRGYTIDQVTGGGKNNPLYAAASTSSPGAELETGGVIGSLGGHGKRVATGDDSYDVEPAKLEDTPVLWRYEGGLATNPRYDKESQLFETTALATKGNDKGTYYGSVTWGWKATASDASPKIEDLKVASAGTPTAKFATAREAWNKDAAFRKLPSVLSGKARLRGTNKAVLKTLEKGSSVWILDYNKVGKKFDLGFFSISKEHYWVKTADGTEGWIRKNALEA